jgi:hypothetical protein
VDCVGRHLARVEVEGLDSAADCQHRQQYYDHRGAHWDGWCGVVVVVVEVVVAVVVVAATDSYCKRTPQAARKRRLGVDVAIVRVCIDRDLMRGVRETSNLPLLENTHTMQTPELSIPV